MVSVVAFVKLLFYLFMKRGFLELSKDAIS